MERYGAAITIYLLNLLEMVYGTVRCGYHHILTESVGNGVWNGLVRP